MALQGFRPRGSISGDLTQASFPFIVSNGVRITTGNAVTLKGGYLENLTALDAMGVLGVAMENVLGTTASLSCIVNCDPNTIYYATGETALANASVGKVFQVATTSGKQYINVTSGAVNSANAFICLKRDPDDVASTTAGLFKIYGGITFNKTLSGLE